MADGGTLHDRKNEGEFRHVFCGAQKCGIIRAAKALNNIRIFADEKDLYTTRFVYREAYVLSVEWLCQGYNWH